MRKNSTPLKRRAFFARLLTNLTFHKKSFYSRRETTPLYISIERYRTPIDRFAIDFWFTSQFKTRSRSVQGTKSADDAALVDDGAW
jgi:hypothetical protein